MLFKIYFSHKTILFMCYLGIYFYSFYRLFHLVNRYNGYYDGYRTIGDNFLLGGEFSEVVKCKLTGRLFIF